jgi:hypothetical protein
MPPRAVAQLAFVMGKDELALRAKIPEGKHEIYPATMSQPSASSRPSSQPPSGNPSVLSFPDQSMHALSGIYEGESKAPAAMQPVSYTQAGTRFEQRPTFQPSGYQPSSLYEHEPDASPAMQSGSYLRASASFVQRPTYQPLQASGHSDPTRQPGDFSNPSVPSIANQPTYGHSGMYEDSSNAPPVKQTVYYTQQGTRFEQRPTYPPPQ